MFKSGCDKLYSKQMDSLRFTQETFLHYFQTLCRVVLVTWFWAIIYRWTCQNHKLSVLGVRVPIKSGMFFCAAAERPAADVIPQLLYKFGILLLDLLSKLLSRLDEARQVR